jgi:hypothetical protein
MSKTTHSLITSQMHVEVLQLSMLVSRHAQSTTRMLYLSRMASQYQPGEMIDVVNELSMDNCLRLQLDMQGTSKLGRLLET